MQTGHAELDPIGNLKPLEAAIRIIPDERWQTGLNGRGRYADAMAREHPALASIYGMRRSMSGDTEFCNEADMAQVDAELARLLDEESHVPTIYRSPYPEAIDKRSERDTKIHANNNAWIGVIAAGGWPIPLYYQFQYGQSGRIIDTNAYSADIHDSTDTHLYYMMLAPRELQREITNTAKLGVLQRQAPAEDPMSAKWLSLGGDHADLVRVSSDDFIDYGIYDAIAIIDHVTDDECFPNLLEKLMNMGSPDERRAYVDRYALLSLDEGLNDPDAKLLLDNAGTMIALRNFNIRYSDGRNMTDTERLEAGQAYLQGIVRMANKLTGQATS